MSKKSKKEEEVKKPADETPVEETPVEETPVEEAVVEETEPKPDGVEESAADETEPKQEEGKEVSEQEEYKDQYLRLRADFENFRKRTRKEKEEWTQRCLENLCSDLLTVLDHFDLGIENSKGKEFTEDTLKGFELVRGQLSSTLSKYGLDEVVVDGGKFDPNVHDAITHMPSPDVEEGGIVAVTRKGYQLGKRQLRPVQVVVSSGVPDEAEGEG